MASDLNFHEWGHERSTGEPVLAVHGFLLGGGFWRRFAEGCRDRFRTVAPDLPGFAGSGQLPPCRSIEELAAAVLGFADDRGLETFHLIGHSMGGCIVQQMALDAGDRIRKLVVYSSSAGIARPGGSAASARSPEERLAVLEKEGVDGLRRWMAPYWFAAGEASPYLEETISCGRGGSPEAARLGPRYMTSWDIHDRLGEIAPPTLVIGGDMDHTFTVEAMTAVARGVRDGSLCVLPNAAHCAHLECGAAFDDAVRAFLSDG